MRNELKEKKPCYSPTRSVTAISRGKKLSFQRNEVSPPRKYDLSISRGTDSLPVI